jgi:hypothetical protein
MVLTLGNSDAIEPQPGTTVSSGDGEKSTAPEPKKIEGDQETTIVLDNSLPLTQALGEIERVWKLHSTGSPTWVEGDDELVVQAVARSFDAPIGRPKEKKE